MVKRGGNTAKNTVALAWAAALFVAAVTLTGCGSGEAPKTGVEPDRPRTLEIDFEGPEIHARIQGTITGISAAEGHENVRISCTGFEVLDRGPVKEMTGFTPEREIDLRVRKLDEGIDEGDRVSATVRISRTPGGLVFTALEMRSL